MTNHLKPPALSTPVTDSSMTAPSSSSSSFMLFKSALNHKEIDKNEAESLLRKEGMKSRDIKLIKKYSSNDCDDQEKYWRQGIYPRPSCQSFIFFLEHLKVNINIISKDILSSSFSSISACVF